MVRKMLIVDDERLIRKGIKSMIERACDSFADIEECVNGAEALERLSKERYDLVITDLRMPGMDGIELIKRSQELENKPLFIILSGYDDFAYAKEAITYQVKEYLLKPIKREELILAMEKAERMLLEEEKIRDEHKSTRETLERMRERQLKYALSSGRLSEAELADILINVDLTVLREPFYVAVENTCMRGEAYGAGNASCKIKSAAQEISGECRQSMIALEDDEGRTVLIVSQSIDQSRIKSHLAAEGCGAGISETMHHVKEIATAYRQAREALKYTFLRGECDIVHFSDIKNLPKDYILPLNKIKSLRELMGTNRTKEIDSILKDIFDCGLLNSYHISYCEGIAASIYKDVIIYALERIPQRRDFIDSQYGDIKEIYKFHSVNDFVKIIAGCIFEINEFLLILQDIYKSRTVIDRAIDFIDKNYNRDITLTVVANYVSLNYSYFSSLFKESTGISFVEYLKGLRIGKAKEMLKNRDYKVMEIAEKVGYCNPKHFSKIFRSLTGITPQEYRDKIL
ncbi:two-component system response regulator YesN [Anaerobacterium chartisolvens]|uniref:Stage 0 sporulation protein A homolog n=1 Tax=Anaerobacterium chartisolvens TaxID=1297424 RepID=A0A369AH83_9FIRM|nr:response regulator [Anaerobacterium chartisolvens]RCX08493.1 two-component system response regulator YesN [Anaerobacterium chartisolvens]